MRIQSLQETNRKLEEEVKNLREKGKEKETTELLKKYIAKIKRLTNSIVVDKNHEISRYNIKSIHHISDELLIKLNSDIPFEKEVPKGTGRPPIEDEKKTSDYQNKSVMGGMSNTLGDKSLSRRLSTIQEIFKITKGDGMTN